MYLPLKIAWKYLFAKKSFHAINYISLITAIAMGIGTAALVIVLSVFNGFEGLVKDLYKVFYTDAIVLPYTGKTFDLDIQFYENLKKKGWIETYNYCIEESALLVYDNKQYIATIKGVDSSYINQNKELTKYKLAGTLDTQIGDNPTAILGAGVATSLGVNVENIFTLLEVYLPKRKKTVDQAFNKGYIIPKGIFAVQQEFDSKYVIVPYSFASSLLESEGKVSKIELKLNPKYIKDISALLDKDYTIKTRYQQNAILFKIMKTEKWIVFSLLVFIISIAAFNIIGALSMLVLEKKKDMFILNAMGAKHSMLLKIFLLEGSLLACLGGGIGIIVALILCGIQQYFGIIPMPGSTFVIDSYPIEIHFLDILIIAVVLFCIALGMSYIPSRKAIKGLDISYSRL